MNQKNNRGEAPNNLHSIFRSQIVQNYPPEKHYSPPVFLEEEVHQEKQQDFMDYFMQNNEIVEEYIHHEEPPKRRSILNFDSMMAEQSDHHEVHSRNSSLSSRENNIQFRDRSFERLPKLLKKYSDDGMDIEQPIENKRSMADFTIHPKPSAQMQVLSHDREKTQKINKIQQVGCNCKKSKCLKMYCECFHLQIFCGENCNCVDCGNSKPNQDHQQAVIDALTRNPKAFEQQNPPVQNGFNLGVELAQVKKGCKCKKTKCLKKYCECYNSGSKCGIFCKCENCENSG